MPSKAVEYRDPDLLFREDEPVIAPEYQAVEGRTSYFGDTAIWFIESLGIPPNKTRTSATLHLSNLPGDWNLFARKFLMAYLNPRHPSLLAIGIHQRNQRPTYGTASNHLRTIRKLFRWASNHNLSTDFAAWTESDIFGLLEHEQQNGSHATTAYLIRLLNKINQLEGLLQSTFRFNLKSIPSPSSAVLELKTQPLPPGDFWSLIRNCWTYIATFGPDIVHAAEELKAMGHEDRNLPVFRCSQISDHHFQAWLDSPHTFIPLHAQTHAPATIMGEINWKETMRQVSGSSNETPMSRPTKTFIAKIHNAIRAGKRTKIGSTSFEPTKVENLDGALQPWIAGLDRTNIRKEITHLRNATVVFILALTMMRASEIVGLKVDCLGTQYGAPVVHGRVYKYRQPTGDPAFWWVSEPVIEAIKQLIPLSTNGGDLFTSFKTKKRVHYLAPIMASFVSRMKELSTEGILKPLSDWDIEPHRLRRSMAILIAAQPNGEIANGISLQHNAQRNLANAVTHAYGHPTESWARELKLAKDEVAVGEIAADWSQFETGSFRLFGPGASQYLKLMEQAGTFNKTKAKLADDRLRRNLLRDDYSNFSLGTINHCLGDLSKAVCLKTAPAGTTLDQTIPSLCNPSVCNNAVITSKHLPLWESEKAELKELLKDRSIAPDHRQRLQLQLQQIQSVIDEKELGYEEH